MLPTLLLTAVAGGAGVARAAETAAVHSPRATVSVISDTDRVVPGVPFHIGLRLQIAPGWHTYWHNPGDAGAAPSLQLALPSGASAGPIAWPAPRATREGPLVAYGYTGTLLLARTVMPGKAATAVAAAPGQTVAAAGFPIVVHAQWLVCKEICVPEHGTFRLDLRMGPPGGTATPSAQAPLFAAAAGTVPRPSPWPATVAPDGRLWLHGPGFDAKAVVRARFIPDQAGAIDNDAAQTLSRARNGIVLQLKPASAGAPAGTMTAALQGIVELVDRSGARTALAVDATPGPVPEITSTVAPARAGPGLLRLLGLGFLGGIILNLMPCVFPVLAMKAMAIARAAERGRMRGLALSYTLGVLAAFAALGGALLAARAAGASAGWGFQFASPTAVAAMALVLFAVGLNMSGVFEVGGGIDGIGQGLAARGGHAGSFFTGLLAVVVATPCTAPFMAVAIGGALAAPPAGALAVFLAMGAGLAAPMALLAVAPGLGRLFPRPGHWMLVLRQALAFPMYAACAWLAWVVSTEAGPSGVLAVGAGLVLLGFAGWVLGLAQRGTRRPGRHLGYGLAMAGGIGAAAVLTWLAGMPAATAGPASSAAERVASAPVPGAAAYSPARLAALRAAGRGVFVDMTAAWCITCQVNERVALAPANVRAAFAAHRVAYLVGDWTRQDATITAYLRAHGRDGVPLYVFYPPGARRGIVLPQLLTPGLVLRTLDAPAAG
ncbi:MAG: thioredoxin family protein [Rhodospirillales bacterium]|nr:thioredoxin family protein [Rhodospirillales bacterium]